MTIESGESIDRGKHQIVRSSLNRTDAVPLAEPNLDESCGLMQFLHGNVNWAANLVSKYFKQDQSSCHHFTRSYL